MRGMRSALAAGAAAIFVTLSASAVSGQDESRQRAPSIRVYSQSGAVSSNYVTPAIEVAEDAYVFAVSFDVDGQIQILHPEFPGISVRMLKNRELRLPNFFTGFSRNDYYGSGRYISTSDYAGMANDSRGSVIALASRTPFNLERLEAGGDWNISAIRRLIEYRPPLAAAQALAAYLGARGEPIGMDYLRFASLQNHDYYASSDLYSCNLYDGGGGIRLRRGAVLNSVAQLQEGGRSVRVVGYDVCGMPIVAYGSSQPNARYRPRNPRDSSDTIYSNGHVRPPRSAQADESYPNTVLGTFPLTSDGGVPQSGDVLIAPLPRERRRGAREIFADPPNESRVGRSAEFSRPDERGNRPRAATPVIGTFPQREYSRPIMRQAPVMQAPRTAAPAPAPAPTRHH
ncbi:MAG TPA: hypothetical protein VIM21_08945 [Gemmatimonadaceae bacterium]